MKIVAKNGLARGGGGARTLLLTVKFMDIGEKNQTNSLWFLFVVLMVKDK